MNVGQEVLVDAGAGVSIDAGATSNFTTSAGDLVLNGASDVDIDAQNYITADADSVVATARKSVKVMATDNVDVDATVDVLVDATQDVRVTAGDEAVLRSTGGTVLVDSETSTVTVDGDQGVAVNASTAGDVDIASAAADVDIDAAQNVLIDAAADDVEVTAADSILLDAPAVAVVQTTTSTTPTTGALIVAGGVGINENLNVEGTLDVDGATTLDQTTIDTEDGQFSVMASSGTNGVDIDVPGGVSIDADQASNFATSAGSITIDAEASTVAIDGSTGVDIDASDSGDVDITADDAVNVTANNAGVAITAESASSLTTNSGTITVTAGGTASDIDANAGRDVTIDAANDVDITAVGTLGIDDARGDITLNADSIIATGGTRFANNVEVDGNLNVDGNSQLDGVVHITNTTTSTGYNSNSALRVSGGISIEDNLNVRNDVQIGINSANDSELHIYGPNSSGSGTGAIQVSGGMGITGDINSEGKIYTDDATPSANTSSGALVVAGGAGIGEDLYIGEDLNVALDVVIGSNLTVQGSSVRFTGGTASTSTTTGELIVSGGVGISGALHAGSITLTTLTVTGSSNIGNDDGDITTIVGSLIVDDGEEITLHAGTNSNNSVDIDGDNTLGYDVTIENSWFNGNDAYIPNLTGSSSLTNLDVDGLTTLDQTTIDVNDGAFNVTTSGSGNGFLVSGAVGLVDIDGTSVGYDVQIEGTGFEGNDVYIPGNLEVDGILNLDGSVDADVTTFDLDGGVVTINGTNGTSDVVIEGTTLDDNNVTIAGILDINGSIDADVSAASIRANGDIELVAGLSGNNSVHIYGTSSADDVQIESFGINDATITSSGDIGINSLTGSIWVEDSRFAGGGLTLGTSGSIAGGLTIEQGTAGINGVLTVNASGDLIITLTNGVTTTVINLTNDGSNRSL